MPQPDLAHAVLSLVSSGAPGLGFAAALLLALAALLPRQERQKLRAPAALLLTHAVVLIARLPLDPETPLARALRVLALFLLVTAIGRAAFLLVVDVILGVRLARPLPRIFRDILQGLVYAGVVLVTLRAAGVEPGSLLTTSALLTAVLGLSAQDTLGNLFAGLALQAQQPFEVGDWIQYDPDPRLVGRVTEINWRATTLITLDEVELTIPNATIAKSALRNFSKPTPLSRRVIEVLAPLDVSPRRVEEALAEAALGMPGVRQDPPPFVLARGFAEHGVTYAVHYFIDDFARRERIDSAVRERAWFALHRADIRIPVPVRAVHLHHETQEVAAEREAEARARRLRSLRGVDFLAALPEESLARLAALSRSRLYMAGEEIIRQGDTGHELYVVDSGEVSVLLGRGEGSVAEVARLGPGKFFGEMSVMTGAPRTATIQAIRDCELCVVDKPAFQEILAAAPHLAEQITEVLVERQAALEESLSTRAVRSTTDREAKSSALLGTIRQFFALR